MPTIRYPLNISPVRIASYLVLQDGDTHTLPAMRMAGRHLLEAEMTVFGLREGEFVKVTLGLGLSNDLASWSDVSDDAWIVSGPSPLVANVPFSLDIGTAHVRLLIRSDEGGPAAIQDLIVRWPTEVAARNTLLDI